MRVIYPVAAVFAQLFGAEQAVACQVARWPAQAAND